MASIFITVIYTSEVSYYQEIIAIIEFHGKSLLIGPFAEDLRSLYKSLGMETTKTEIDEMLKEVSGAMNHTKFTCMLASRTGDVDDAQVSSPFNSCINISYIWHPSYMAY